MARKQYKSTGEQVRRLVTDGKPEQAYVFLVDHKWVPQGSGKQPTLPTGLTIYSNLGKGRCILTSVNGTMWAWEFPPAYADINLDVESHPQDGLRLMLAMLARSTSHEARALASGAVSHIPVEHKDGWTIVLETPMGFVTLWYSWLGNHLVLSCPSQKTLLLDQLVKDGKAASMLKIVKRYYSMHFGKVMIPIKEKLTEAQAYEFLQSLDVPELYKELTRELGELTWPRRLPVLTSLVKSILGVEFAMPVANEIFGERLWASFYGPHLADGGRVWIDYTESVPDGHYAWVDNNGRLTRMPYGHNRSMFIHTLPFSFFSAAEPDAPSARPEAILPYRNHFLNLACAIAEMMGGIRSITIDYGFVHVPETIESAGYEYVTWIKGIPGTRIGWEKEIVRATKGTETLFLVSGNSLVPWSTVRHVTDIRANTLEQLLELLTF